jgi:hypothetical protein
MKKLNSAYFILFLLVITGGFAAIARNSYGIEILGWSVVGFSFFSLVGGISALLSTRDPKLLAAEYFTLTVLFAIVAMRIFLIHFPYVELIFSITGAVIIVIYILQILNAYRSINAENHLYSTSLILLYSSIAIYALALVVNPTSIFISEILGLIGFAIFIGSFISTRRIKTIIVRDKEMKWTKYLSIQPNRAVLLISLFVMFTLYSGGNYFKVIPEIQSSSMPNGYYQLVKEAESGKDIPANGQYRYELYREHMEKFAKNQGLEK